MIYDEETGLPKAKEININKLQNTKDPEKIQKKINKCRKIKLKYTNAIYSIECV